MKKPCNNWSFNWSLFIWCFVVLLLSPLWLLQELRAGLHLLFLIMSDKWRGIFHNQAGI